MSRCARNQSAERGRRTFASLSSELFMPMADICVHCSSCIASSVTTIRTPSRSRWISIRATTSYGGDAGDEVDHGLVPDFSRQH